MKRVNCKMEVLTLLREKSFLPDNVIMKGGKIFIKYGIANSEVFSALALIREKHFSFTFTPEGRDWIGLEIY